MVEENKETKVEEKKVEAKTEEKKVEAKTEEKKVEAKTEEKKVEAKTEEKKKIKAKEIPKKDVAIANGYSLKISPRQSKYICRIIRRKSPEAAIARLQAVIDEKRPVPMAGMEVGHKKGKGLAGGKFPKNASKAIMDIVKQAGANAVVAGIENPIIMIARSDRASAPYRRAGRKAKRTHLYIEVREKAKLAEKKK
jgi:ribosomal protein L22